MSIQNTVPSNSVGLAVMNAATQPTFRIAALRDYYEDLTSSFGSFIDALSTPYSSLNDEETDYTVDQLRSHFLEAIITGTRFTGDAQLAIDDGYVTVGELSQLMADTYANEAYNYALGLDDPTMTASNGVAYTFTEAVALWKTSYHGLVATAALYGAWNQASVADKLSYFRDRISRAFSNAYAAVSNVMDWGVELLQTPLTDSEFLDSISAQTGMSAQAVSDVLIAPTTTDMSQYSGSSPLNSAAIAAVGKGVAKVATVAAKAVAGVVVGIGAAIGKVFKKVATKVLNVCTNPVDVVVIDEDAASYTIDDLAYVCEMPGDYASDMPYGTYKYSLWCGEICVQTTSSTAKVAFKPRCVDPKSIPGFSADKPCGTYFPGAQMDESSIPGTYFSYALEHTEKCCQMVTYLNPDDTNESQLYAGFSCAMCYLLTYVGMLYEMIMVPSSSNPLCHLPFQKEYLGWDAHDIATYNEIVSSTQTNADFCAIVSGWNGQTFTQFGGLNLRADDITGVDYFYSVLATLGAWYRTKEARPLDYPFLAFRKDKEVFSPGRFRLKTDAENGNALTAFVAACIVLVVVVVVVVAVGVVAGKVATKLFNSRARKLRQLQGKMQSGEPLSRKELRKLRKLTAKQNAALQLSSGMTASSLPTAEDSQTSDDSVMNQISVIYSAIAGSEEET